MLTCWIGETAGGLLPAPEGICAAETLLLIELNELPGLVMFAPTGVAEPLYDCGELLPLILGKLPELLGVPPAPYPPPPLPLQALAAELEPAEEGKLVEFPAASALFGVELFAFLECIKPMPESAFPPAYDGRVLCLQQSQPVKIIPRV
ncbi:MAG: hypothetical protein ACYC3I_27265 [Gemmataceae bacterium]